MRQTEKEFIDPELNQFMYTN